MTLGEKIVHLRAVNNISQEKLAKMLKISRQSISKWESDESTPQIEKIVELCKLFDVTADELIDDQIVIHKNKDFIIDSNIKNKYFGTDGFRGEANKILKSDHAYKIGRFLGWFFSNPKYSLHKQGYRPRIVIGKDTRRSSYMYEYAIAAGLAASGADVYLLHVTTTPSVSYITRTEGFDCGIMITASHNPYYDNGIKILNALGEKLDNSISSLIESYIDGDLNKLGIEEDDLPLATKENIGIIIDYVAGRNRYIGYLISVAMHSYKDLKIGLDAANGSAWMIARSVFSTLGAKVYTINDNPNGLNINLDAGSTHIEKLCQFVKDNKLDIGFAFDGDADRCIAVDENGNVIDGDKIIYILARKLKQEGALLDNTVVTTVMSNKGLSKALKELGIEEVKTDVGDRFVYAAMQEGGYTLGGEQSGHIIYRKYATTGDGILTALMITEQVLEEKEKLSKLCNSVKIYPQKLVNVHVTSKDSVMKDSVILEKYAVLQKEIDDSGRILLRKSGTEPVVRIMVEAETLKMCDYYIDKLYLLLKKRGYVCD